MQYVKITLPTWRKIERVLKEFDRLDITRTQGNAYGTDETVLIRNDSTVIFERFHVMQMNGVVVTPDISLQDFQQRPVFTGTVPTDTPNAEGRLVICTEPIAPGQIGRAWADGVVMTQIDVTDNEHHYATIKPHDMSQLKSDESGLCYILWKESGIGTKWAVVRIGGGSGSGNSERWAFLKQTPSSNDSGQLQCRLDDPLTGEIVKVYFILLNCSGVGGGHLSLKIDTPIRVAKQGKNWYFTGHIEGTEETTCD